MTDQDLYDNNNGGDYSCSHNDWPKRVRPPSLSIAVLHTQQAGGASRRGCLGHHSKVQIAVLCTIHSSS